MYKYGKLIILSIALIFVLGNCNICIGQDEVQFYYTTASFKNLDNPTKTYEEVYISFWNNELTYLEKQEKLIGGYEINIAFLDKNGGTITEKNWQGFVSLDSISQSTEQISLEIAGFLLQPKLYNIKIQVKDLNSNIVGVQKNEVVVSKFIDNMTQLSNIEFARSIKRKAKDNKFVKNNLEVLPYPSLIYGIESKFLYFYSEIYQLVVGRNYTKQIQIIDSNTEIVHSSEQSMQVKSENSVWVDKLNLLKLETGRYILQLKLTDDESGKTVSTESEFWMHSPQDMITFTDITDEELEEYRNQIVYLVDRKELKLFDDLNKEGKIEYLAQFWSEKTSDFKQKHQLLYNTANERFSSATIPGWKTDRGRIFIMYGKPDEMERYPASMDTRAHQVWIYESLAQQSRVVFVFCDFGITGNYQLIHSNLKSGERAEIYNPNWRDEISRTIR